MKPRLSVKAVGAAVVALTGVSTIALQGASAAKAPRNPFAGKTIDLVSSGGPGSTHDLYARAVAPGIAKYLHCTVDVVDMPGGGQLLAWNYINNAKPNGLTIGTVDVEGTLANLWEKVPNNSVNPAKMTWLGGFPGEGNAAVLYATKTPPSSLSGVLSSIYSIIKDRSVTIDELGSVGDVPGPTFFKLYHVPSTDLTSYGNATEQLAGIQRGDGPVSVKSWGGGWASWVEAGKGRPLLSFTMTKTWKGHPGVPTLADVFAKDPPKAGAAALIADSKALDAGTGIFGPPKLSKIDAQWLAAAVKSSMHGAFYKKAATNAQIQLGYESPAAQEAAVKYGVQAKTIALLRKYVPLSGGVAS